MKITSPVFANNQNIPKEYTCDGENISPPLEFSGVPVNTKSLTLIVDDPDASNKDFVHWLVWNINPNSSKIGQNSVPYDSVEGTTDFGTLGWGGPCPPAGRHRYYFNLYALDTLLDLPTSTRKADLEVKMQDHILDKTELIGIYQRNKPS